MSQGAAETNRLTTLGEFFRFYRRKNNLKQDEVAERVGVTKNTVSQIERGQQWPSMQTYFRFLDALELTRYDVTDHAIAESVFRRSEILNELGLEDWYESMNDDEFRYALMRAWEGVELMREMERRGLDHPFKRFSRAPLDLLAPDEITERTERARKGLWPTPSSDPVV